MYNLSYCYRENLWHIMLPLHRDMRGSACEIHLRAGTRFVDYISEITKQGSKEFPNPSYHVGEPPVIDTFKYKNICKKCIKLEITNIKEFKSWLIIQKLKYL